MAWIVASMAHQSLQAFIEESAEVAQGFWDGMMWLT